MRIHLITGMLLLSMGISAQQIASGVYWVSFSDKEGTEYSCEHPEDFLSERSISRRAIQGLAVDARDLPVRQDYLQEISDMGVEVRHISRWLNGVVMINMNDATFLQVLEKPFTDTLAWVPPPEEAFYPAWKGSPRFDPPLEQAPGYDYGVATEQVSLLQTNHLHELGFTGKGVWIGVLDAGFYNVDSLPSFETMFEEDRLLGTRNYVDESPIFRQNSRHGMYVLSTMAGEWNENMVGTAPHASYLLCMTENPGMETRIEEMAWIEAAEYADSLGVDVINTSLGYSDFDGDSFDYTYRDMDGKTSHVSRAASLLASRGMLACISAGNEGNDDWFYITAPADASDILTVGAVDSLKLIAGFSSRGPTFDARIKPDVTSMGVASGLQSGDGGLARGGGTSFASPILAGSVASLWQAFPDLSATELIHMIRQSGDNHMNPDATYGFGLPDFIRTYHSITAVPVHRAALEMELWPNPVQEQLMIRIPEDFSSRQQIRFYDMNGRLVLSLHSTLPAAITLPENMGSAIYIVEIITRDHIYRSRIIKE